MMMKALIRKQFGEYFSSYYVDRKTGKPCSKGRVTAKFIGFAVLCLFLCAMFSLQALGLGQILDPETTEALQAAGMAAADFDPGRLYFTLMGILSILMGTFGSVFNTYAGMYLAKDNDILLSMPIPPRRILASRLIGVYGLALLYSAMIWLPSCVVYCILSPAVTPAAVILQALLLFIIPFFVSVLTCVMGWIVALVSGKLKNKSFITVLISLVCFGLYYFICFKFGDFMQTLISNGAAVDAGLNRWVRFLCWMGEGATGSFLSFLIFTGITAVLCIITFLVLSRSFYHIALHTAPAGNSGKAVKKASAQISAGAKSPRKALYMRELQRFTSSPTYMLNCGLGLVMLPVISVVLLINANSFMPAITMLAQTSPLLENALVPAVLLLVGFMAAINCISTPSVSLEGKSLWILRSLPVTGKQVLQAKLMLHVSLGALPVCVSVLLVGIAAGCTPLQCVLMVIFGFLFTVYTGLFGLILGVQRPDFNWTNETYPIKQSSNVLFALLAGWGANLLLPGLCWAAGLIMDPTLSLGLTTALEALVCFLLLRIMNTKSAARFDRL